MTAFYAATQLSRAMLPGRRADFAKVAICALVSLELTEADFRFVPFCTNDNARD
jgi:hypothetical protein